jgi:RNA polymerase sigma-70 factor (ECF subfamily)
VVVGRDDPPAIDYLRSARVNRKAYVGPWLPEPLLADQTPDVAEHAVVSDSLSMAFPVLLKSLSPVERAVFLLREVFGYGYDEIATVVGRSPDNCRQFAVRARRHLEARKPRFEADRRQRELAERFLAASSAGDLDGLIGSRPRSTALVTVSVGAPLCVICWQSG